MLNPRYERYAERLENLIEEGENVATYASEKDALNRFTGESKRPLYSWLAKVENVLQSAFGKGSAHYGQFSAMQESGIGKRREVFAITGILEGALKDLRDGFLVGQEFLIAGEVFDSVLDQARHLNDRGYKDPAAVLGRVVLEDALERIAREEGIDIDQETSRINTELRKEERYSKPQWRRIQSWLDIGNAAAHGDFDEYVEGEVVDMLDGIEKFLAAQLRG